MKRAMMVGLVLAGGAAMAQTGAKQSGEAVAQTGAKPGGDAVVIARSVDAGAVASALAKASGQLVAVDPAVTGAVRSDIEKRSLEEGLSAMATQLHAQWRKVYLMATEIPRLSDGRLDVARLKAIAEKGDLGPAVSTAVVDPQTGAMTITIRGAAASPALAEWAKSRTPVYVLFRPTPGGPASLIGDGPSGYAASQQELLDRYHQMTPEQRWQASQALLASQVNGDPHALVELVMNTMSGVGMLPPEGREKIMSIVAEVKEKAHAAN